MVSTILWILLLVALVAGPVAAGVLRRDAAWPDWLAVAGAAAIGIVFAVLAATTHQEGVTSEAMAKGMAIAFVIGGLPAYALYALGRALAKHRVLLSFICLALTIPAAAMYFVGWIVVLDYAHCPPDAYECPI